MDGSGKIRYTEFLAATIEARGAISEIRLAEAFDRLDWLVLGIVFLFISFLIVCYFEHKSKFTSILAFVNLDTQ